KAFPAKQRAFDLPDILNVVIHGGLECHDTTRVHPDDFARFEVALVDGAAGMDESQAVALQPLENESFSAEKSRAESLREGNAQTHAFGRAQESILLRQQFAAELGQVDGYDLPRVRRAEGHVFLALRSILEHSHEQRFAR